MEVSNFVLRLAVVLLPGITCALLYERLVIMKVWSQFRFSLYSLILGLLSYLTLQLVVLVWSIILFVGVHLPTFTTYWLSVRELQFWYLIANTSIAWPEVLASTLIALPLSFLLAFLENKKLLQKLASKYNISNKYGDESLFYFFLNSKAIEEVYVRDEKNSLTYFGKLQSYSESEDSHELVLYNVDVYSANQVEKLYSVPYMYLCSRKTDTIIEVPA
jgi:hypothetical protein